MSVDIAQEAFLAALAIERADTLSGIQERIRTFAAPKGFDRFVLFSTATSEDEVVDRIYWVEGNWFGDGEAVDAVTYLRHCPVTRHMLQATEPFFWSKVRAEKGACYQIVRTPRGRGVHGVQVPIFGPSGLEGAVSLGGECIESSPSIRLAMLMVGSAAFVSARRLLELPAATTIGRLSEREREVLAWTAAGRRQADIAATLGLSERTVENHLRRIRRRLGATTTTQAIGVAIRNGEIKI